jgi:hypothetical protein
MNNGNMASMLTSYNLLLKVIVEHPSMLVFAMCMVQRPLTVQDSRFNI